MSNFEKCDNLGKRYELETFINLSGKMADILNYGYTWNNSCHPEYDMKIISKYNNKITTLEVKAQQTSPNHFWIEFLQKGKPSGIDATKSDFYYIYKINSSDNSYKLYIIPTQDIKDIIKKILSSEDSKSYLSPYGDNNNKSWVIPIEMFNTEPAFEGKLNKKELDNYENNNKIIYPYTPETRDISNKIFYFSNNIKDKFKDPSRLSPSLLKGGNNLMDKLNNPFRI